MEIKSFKVIEQPKIHHKILETELYKEYLTEDKTILKKMKVESQAYRDLLLFHDYGEYRKYLIELSKLMGDDSIINVPTTIYSYLGKVKSTVQNITPGAMDFTSLAPKLSLDDFLESLKAFYEELASIDYLNLTHIKGCDISYSKKIEIFNPEFIKIENTSVLDNIAHINRELLKSIYGLEDITMGDPEIEEMLAYALNGKIGVDKLLTTIKNLESIRRGKAKYLKHISKGYIK